MQQNLENARYEIEKLSIAIQNDPNADLQELGVKIESAKTNIESSETAVTSLTESVQEGEVEAQAILNDTQNLQRDLQVSGAEAEQRLEQTVNTQQEDSQAGN